LTVPTRSCIPIVPSSYVREYIDFVAVLEREGAGGALVLDVLFVDEDVDVGSYHPSLVADAVSEPFVRAVDGVEQLLEVVRLDREVRLDL